MISGLFSEGSEAKVKKLCGSFTTQVLIKQGFGQAVKEVKQVFLL